MKLKKRNHKIFWNFFQVQIYEINPVWWPTATGAKGLLQKSGEPLDGCLTFEEFAEVMKAMAEFNITEEKDSPVSTPPESITYVSYEVHESLGFDYAVVSYSRIHPSSLSTFD